LQRKSALKIRIKIRFYPDSIGSGDPNSEYGSGSRKARIVPKNGNYDEHSCFEELSRGLQAPSGAWKSFFLRGLRML
jgi:hypothetical protein